MNNNNINNFIKIFMVERKIEFDILKGILITFVVTGHIGANVGFDVYWFHMPAFFMISGYLTKHFISLNDIKIIFVSIKKHDKEQLKRTLHRFQKFVIPYFAYCVTFYLIYRPESLAKNIVRTLYAGGNNITIYSYPYWFINALMIGLLFYGTIKDKKYNIIYLIAVYLIIHLNVLKLLPIQLPWSLDEGLGALIFIAIGDSFKKINIEDRRLYLIVFLAIIFILLGKYHVLDFKLNMKDMTYSNYILDILIPVSFTYLFFLISKIISKIPFFRNIFIQTGLCCMTVFYTHAALLWSYRGFGIDNHTLLTLLIVITGIIIHYIFKSNKITSFLFLSK